jgi:putative SOS response-associated peptidase YedK
VRLDLPIVCGRFSQERPASELAEIFAAEPLADELGPRWNVAPTDEAYVVVQRSDRRAIVAYRWGLIPHWAENAKVASRMFNARSETLTRSPAFADALRRKRCLVPVDGFYEWRRIGERRQPFSIGRTDRRPLALAGLWSGWRDPAKDAVVRTFTIVTTRPNDQMASLHDRMPVVVPEGRWDLWLDPDLEDPAELQGLFEPTDEIALRIEPVRDLVNNVRNDGPELVEPIDLAAIAADTAAPPGLFD